MSERPKVGISQACLYDKKTAHHIRHGLDYIIDLWVKAGFDGIEVHPAKWPRNIEETAKKSQYQNRILSGHQTFERSTMPESTQSYLQLFIVNSILSQYNQSIEELNELFSQIGKRPVVAYHHITRETSTDNFSDISIQIKPNAFSYWNINCLDGFIDKVHENGFTSVTFDTTHALTTLERYPQLKNLHHIIDTLGEHKLLNHVHLAAARPDNYSSVDNGTNTQKKWGFQLLNWVEGEMLDLISHTKDAGANTYIVEFLPSGMNDVDPTLPYWYWDEKTLVYVGSKIAGSVQRTLDQSGNW